MVDRSYRERLAAAAHTLRGAGKGEISRKCARRESARRNEPESLENLTAIDFAVLRVPEIASHLRSSRPHLADTTTGFAFLLQPCKVIFASVRTVAVIMPSVLKGVATLPLGSSAITPPSPCCSTSSFITTSFAA